MHMSKQWIPGGFPHSAHSVPEVKILTLLSNNVQCAWG